MKAILLRLAVRKEVGLAIGESEIAACVVAVTPIGRVEVARLKVPFEPDRLAQSLEGLLAGCLGPEDRERCRVTVGLPALRVFFSARPIQDEHQNASPAALLHEVIQSPTLIIDDMVVDMIKHRLGQRTLACIVSCRRRYINAVVAALQGAGVRPSRSEPSPCALLRLAARRHKAPRGARAIVRVFLGRKVGLAVLVTDGDLPLMWRPFGLPEGSESEAIFAAVASVRSPGVYCGLDSDIGAVLIHGRPELGGFAELASSPALAGLKTLRHDGPSLDQQDVAVGLALRPSQKIEAFNLVGSFAARASLRDIFPWGQTLLHAAVLVAATFFLRGRLDGYRAEAEAAKAADAKYAWAAKLPAAKLQAEKKTLEQRVEAVRSFLESRSTWTGYARDLAQRLPADLATTSIAGTHELDLAGSKGARPRHSLVVGLRAPIPKTGAMPREIDALLRTLRDDPLLRREFPEVELADLRWTQGSDRAPSASFNVLCRPTRVAPAKAPAGGEARAKAKK